MGRQWRRVLLLLVSIAALCLLAYGRALSLPFISDDYLQIRLARQYGPVERWADLAADPLYRCRATSLLLSYWIDRLFGVSELAPNLASVFLHILCSWLVIALGFWKPVGWRVSAAAACFFAVQQGHQEAVIWYAALPELLVFLFSVSSFLLWLVWMNGGPRPGLAYAASLLCYALALLSKESAVCAAGLVALSLLLDPSAFRRKALHAAPYALLAAGYFALAYLRRSSHLHFNDGTFSLGAHFLLVLVRSTGRLLWVWGFLALITLAAWRRRESQPLVALAAAWIALTLLPYSFLTYQPHVPSRHTYFASVGLAFLVGAAFLVLRDRFPRRAAPALLVALLVAHQISYLWTRKHRQYLERAEPTERLIRFARSRSGPIHVECFPYTGEVAESAVTLAVGPRGLPVYINRGSAPRRSDILNLCAASGSR
jgi:hypothetical protein